MSEKGAPQLTFELVPPDEGRAGVGAFLAMGLYFVEIVSVLLIADSIASEHRGLIIGILGAPLVQFVYIIPLYLAWKSSGKSATANGLMGGAIALAIIHYIIVGVI